jgi:acetyl esterase/lipase
VVHQKMIKAPKTVGYSAGAHLAVFLGSLAMNHLGDEANLLSNQSPKVSCVVDFYGPVDLTRVSYPNSYYALFGINLYNEAVLREASPVFDVSSQSAPTLIIQGTKDSLVPHQQVISVLAQALAFLIGSLPPASQ